jgi:hypothetical protein
MIAPYDEFPVAARLILSTSHAVVLPCLPAEYAKHNCAATHWEIQL